MTSRIGDRKSATRVSSLPNKIGPYNINRRCTVQWNLINLFFSLEENSGIYSLFFSSWYVGKFSRRSVLWRDTEAQVKGQPSFPGKTHTREGTKEKRKTDEVENFFFSSQLRLFSRQKLGTAAQNRKKKERKENLTFFLLIRSYTTSVNGDVGSILPHAQ